METGPTGPQDAVSVQQYALGGVAAALPAGALEGATRIAQGTGRAKIRAVGCVAWREIVFRGDSAEAAPVVVAAAPAAAPAPEPAPLQKTK